MVRWSAKGKSRDDESVSLRPSRLFDLSFGIVSVVVAVHQSGLQGLATFVIEDSLFSILVKIPRHTVARTAVKAYANNSHVAC